MRDTPHSHAHTSQQKAEPTKQQQLATCAAKQPFPKQLRRHEFPRMVTAQGSLPQVNKALLLRAGLYSASHVGAKWANFLFFFFKAAKGEAKPPSLYIKLPTETFGAWPEAEEARATFQLLATLLNSVQKQHGNCPMVRPLLQIRRRARIARGAQQSGSIAHLWVAISKSFLGCQVGNLVFPSFQHLLSACTHSSHCPEGQQ